jgi:hypothetical protein
MVFNLPYPLASPQLSGHITDPGLVDFDDQPGGIPPIITDGSFNEHVSLSTNDPNMLLILSGAGFVGGSPPNILSAGISPTTENFNGDIYMDFTVAANNVSIDVVSDNDAGMVASMGIFHSGGSDELDIIGNGDFTDVINMDLSNFQDITRFELFSITDEFGLGIDILAFGMMGVAATRRRR